MPDGGDLLKRPDLTLPIQNFIYEELFSACGDNYEKFENRNNLIQTN